MGVSGAGAAFIVLSVLLFIVGILLCLYGYKKSREANRLGAEYKQTYDQRVQNHRVQGRPPGASPWAPYEPSPFAPPAAAGPPPLDPAAGGGGGGGVVGVVPPPQEGADRAVETDTGILRDGRQLANVMEEQTRLEKDIHRLENEQWALDNKWEGVVKVSQMTGEQHEVEFVSTDTLSVLKMRLYDLTGVIPQRIVLSYAGKLLVPDTYMLGAFRVPENPTLFMVATANDPDAPAGAALAPPAGPANSEMKALQTKEATLQFRKDAGEDVADEEQALQEERRVLEAKLGSSAAHPTAAAAAVPSVQQRPGESDEDFQARRLHAEREAYRAKEGGAAATAAGTESVTAAAAAAAPAASAADQQEQQAQQEQQEQQPQPASS